jgi:hypothetical protein
MSENLDLFAWAASQPSCQIIDGRRQFEEMEAIRVIRKILGPPLPRFKGEVINLADARRAALQSRRALFNLSRAAQ